MGELILGVDFKRSNSKADRAFWIGREPEPIELLAVEIMSQCIDTTPCEYVAPESDPA